MRKLFSILLLAAFWLPYATPLFAADAENGVPACCRRSGAHHCQMRAHGSTPDKHVQIRTTLAPCPYRGAASVPAQAPMAAAPDVHTFCVADAAHPAGIAQTESRWRMARERSRGKRGPPHLLG